MTGNGLGKSLVTCVVDGLSSTTQSFLTLCVYNKIEIMDWPLFFNKEMWSMYATMIM